MSSETNAASLIARIDRLSVWPYPYSVLVIVGAGFFFSFFDIVTIAFAMPVISQQFKVSADAVSWAVTSGLLGYIVGALLLSRLADALGRKIGLLISVILFSLGSILSATSTDLSWLIVWRFIIGMGIGAEIALVTTYMGEISPAPLRGRFSCLSILFGMLGFALVPVVALLLVPNFEWGWRALFVIGGIGGATIGVLRRKLPDSARWLMQKGKYQQAQELVEKAESCAEQRSGQPLSAVTPVENAAAEVKSFQAILTPPYVNRLLLLMAVWFFYYVGNYAWLTLTPELLAKIDIKLQQSFLSLSITGVGFVAGSLTAFYWIDRIERKLAAIVAAIIWSSTLIVIGVFPSVHTLLFAGLLASFTIGFIIPVLYTYTGESFPTAFRATAVALSDGVGHLGGAFCGQIIFAAYHSWGFPGAFITMALSGLITAVLLFFGAKSTGRKLDSI